jgi:hypothetical protein
MWTLCALFNPNLKETGMLQPGSDFGGDGNDETRLRLPFYFLFRTSPYLKTPLDDDNTGIFIR